MKCTAILSFLLVLMSLGCRAAVATAVSVSNQPTSLVAAPPPSKRVAEVSWTDAPEKFQKVAEFRGKVRILDLCATYCGPWREEIPHLKSLLVRDGEDNSQIIGLNVGGAQHKPEIPKFTAAITIGSRSDFPEPALTQYIFAERSDIPQTVVIGRDGQIVTKIIGFDAQIQHQLDAAVEQAVKN